MKYRLLAVLAAASALTLARAQDDDRQQRPATEIPDFGNLDEFVYEPRSTVILSFRHLSGAKTQFSGTGTLLPPEGAVDFAGANLTRQYHDGSVLPDSRTTPRSDPGGNPVIDAEGGGGAAGDPITPDGKTNNWSYKNQGQVDNSPLGYIAFHSYSAMVTDTAVRDASTKSTNGLDLAVSHDMGKFFGGKVSWNLMAGMSVNDISGKKTDRVAATVTKTTDYYSTFGQTVPAAPYSAPSATSTTITDSNGNTQVVSVDTTVLISSAPVYRDESPSAGTTNGFVTDSWKLKGAYYTFRAGPELVFPFTEHFRATLSVGVAMVYSGTTYSVTQTLTPDTGDDIVKVDTNSAYKLRPGYYADASLDYDITDKTGLFAGAVFQSAQGYTQELHTTTANYAAKVDLTNQNGFRAGMSIRF